MLKTVSSTTNAIGALNYKGTWDANTNTPSLASGVGVKGDYYQVSVAGSTSLDGISNWGVGDVAAFNGTTWQRLEGGADLNGVNLSVTNDGVMNGVSVGKGGGAISTNVRVGIDSMSGNTTGASNTAVGFEALRVNSTGGVNTAVGRGALRANTTGTENTAVGFGAVQTASTASGNTAVGRAALNAVTSSNNTAVGLYAATVQTSGDSTVAVGYLALNTNTTGVRNTAIGQSALQVSTTPSNNTAVGHGAGSAITTGANHTIIGRYTGNNGGLDIRTLSGYVVLSDGNGTPRGYHTGTTWVFPSLPTSSAGLPSGAIWNDAGTLKIVP